MSCREDMRGEAVSQSYAVTPVTFPNAGCGVSPFLEMRANAEATNHLLHSRANLRHRVIVKVIPVIMRDEENVDIRNVGHRVGICSVECFRSERHRRGSPAEYWVNQDSLTIDLQKV